MAKEVECHFCKLKGMMLPIGTLTKKSSDLCTCKSKHTYMATSATITRINKELVKYEKTHRPKKDKPERGIYKCRYCLGWGERISTTVMSTAYTDTPGKLTGDTSKIECRYCNGEGYVDWVTRIKMDNQFDGVPFR